MRLLVREQNECHAEYISQKKIKMALLAWIWTDEYWRSWRIVWSLEHQLVESRIVNEAKQLGQLFAEQFYEH